MAINVAAANAIASQIKACGDNLSSEKSKVASYKSQLNANWVSKEMLYINNSASNVNSNISSAVSAVSSLSSEIRSAAAAIYAEELAAEKAAEEARQREEARRQDEARKARAYEQQTKMVR
ncbi:MAG: hypothetical protein RSA79_03255 [Oscillospiraceae bacterium]